MGKSAIHNSLRIRKSEFIRDSVMELDAALQRLSLQAGSGLIVRYARAVSEVVELASILKVQAVFASHDDEPQSLVRDAAVAAALAQRSIVFKTCKDHVQIS